jgi:hypothetical protein
MPDRRPHQGDATIVCDGSGGYRVDLRGWAGRPCGSRPASAVTSSSTSPTGSDAGPTGARTSPTAATSPWAATGYAAFLRASECSAYGVELTCATTALASATGDCRATLRAHVADTRAQRDRHCS